MAIYCNIWVHMPIYSHIRPYIAHWKGAKRPVPPMLKEQGRWCPRGICLHIYIYIYISEVVQIRNETTENEKHETKRNDTHSETLHCKTKRNDIQPMHQHAKRNETIFLQNETRAKRNETENNEKRYGGSAETRRPRHTSMYMAKQLRHRVVVRWRNYFGRRARSGWGPGPGPRQMCIYIYIYIYMYICRRPEAFREGLSYGELAVYPLRGALQKCVICRKATASAAQQPLLWKRTTESGSVLWNYYI